MCAAVFVWVKINKSFLVQQFFKNAGVGSGTRSPRWLRSNHSTKIYECIYLRETAQISLSKVLSHPIKLYPESLVAIRSKERKRNLWYSRRKRRETPENPADGTSLVSQGCLFNDSSQYQKFHVKSRFSVRSFKHLLLILVPTAKIGRFAPSFAKCQISLAFFLSDWKQTSLVWLYWMGQHFYKRNLFYSLRWKKVNFSAMIAPQSSGTPRPRLCASIFEKLLYQKTFIDLTFFQYKTGCRTNPCSSPFYITILNYYLK